MKIRIKGKSLEEVRKLLEPLACKMDDDAIIFLYTEPGKLAGAIKKNNSGNIDVLNPGTFTGYTTSEGVGIRFEEKEFPDRALFEWVAGKIRQKLGGEWDMGEPRRPTPPKPPRKGETGAKLSKWFDWYEQMKAEGFNKTLGDIAAESGYSYGYVKNRRSNYKREHVT